MKRIGIDVGGTNTDAVLVDGQALAPTLRFTLTGDVGTVELPRPANPGAARRLTLRRGADQRLERQVGDRARPAPGQRVGPEACPETLLRLVRHGHRGRAPCSSARSSGVSTEPAFSTMSAIS